MSYDTHDMVYRLGKRAKFYRLRHLRGIVRLRPAIRWRVALVGSMSVLALGAIGVVSSQQGIAHIPGATWLAKKQSSNSSHKDNVMAVNRKGSSKPPPKGTIAATTAAVSSDAAIPDISCNVFPAGHSGLSGSSAPELRKLAQYEQLCSGAVAARTSFFVPTPATTAQAQASARDVASTLKAYAQAGVAPLVFMEPDDLYGNNLDLAQYANGTYDSALNAYFAALQSNGVTPAMMGTWVFVPEGNLPGWSTVDPNIFAAVVTKTAQLQKQYFPGSQSSIMLDSESYPVGGTWGDGRYVSLVPYVQNIPRGLIDSFGLQGFPWVGQGGSNAVYDPRTYLRVDFAMQAAQALGINNIWFNTGTFNQMYAHQSGTVTASPGQRQTMLTATIQQAKQAKAQGFAVSIHIFAENKANVGEATDWSYWQSTPGDGPSTAVFTGFAHDAAASGIPIWLFDTAD
jgi:hypothetical protein